MPKAAHRTCPSCGSVTTGAEVDPDRRVLVCDLCGAVTPFRLLPPLLLLTGASGVGRTTLYRHLLGRISEAILIDADLLWSVNPAHDNATSGYRQFRALIVHLAERLAANAQPVLLEGTCTLDQYETLGERWYFSNTAYLAVVCDDETLRRRLEARPDWRRSRQDLEPMIRLDQAFPRSAFRSAIRRARHDRSFDRRMRRRPPRLDPCPGSGLAQYRATRRADPTLKSATCGFGTSSFACDGLGLVTAVIPTQPGRRSG